jgi:8-oxo-dGTP pyrophosphatase MutT (NUDIX family)
MEALDEPLAPDALGDATPAAPRLIVDVWLAVPGPSGWRVLMLHRSPHHGPFWQGVSGGVEADDGSLLAAARRELGEELGLDDPAIPIVDLGLGYVFTSPLSGRTYRKRSLGALLPPGTSPGTVRLSDEHDEARLVTFAEALALVAFPENRDELRALEARLA